MFLPSLEVVQVLSETCSGVGLLHRILIYKPISQ